jgi:hypothetical protein
MRKFLLIVFFSLFACIQTRAAADEFDTVKCGSDIPKAMIGKHSPNDRVVVTEARHRDLGLKDIGGDEISDRLSGVLWRICGHEYEELVDDKGLVRDVLPMPDATLTSPLSFLDRCKVDGQQIPDDVIAVLDNGQGRRPKSRDEEIWLPAKVAWKIDEHSLRFTPRQTEGLNCVVDDFGADVKQ